MDIAVSDELARLELEVLAAKETLRCVKAARKKLRRKVNGGPWWYVPREKLVASLKDTMLRLWLLAVFLLGLFFFWPDSPSGILWLFYVGWVFSSIRRWISIGCGWEQCSCMSAQLARDKKFSAEKVEAR